MLYHNIKICIKKLCKEYKKRVIRMSSNDMEDLLNNFKKKEVNPTAAIVEPVEDKKNEQLSKIIKKKEKVEDTHTRRTFLVRNELLKELDDLASQINNTGFKKEFINYVIEKGLIELKSIDKRS